MRIVLICILSLMTFNGFGQFCKDTLQQPEPFHACYSSYNPVCGCDNITYRNDCAAQYWGGLINNGFNIGWTENTICGNFDFDFTPTAVEYFPVEFSLVMKFRGSAQLYIYNRYGGLVYTDIFSVFDPSVITTRQLNLQFLEIGVYLAVVVVNGEKQYKKFGKVNNTIK